MWIDKDQIANAVKAQLLPADYDWREATWHGSIGTECTECTDTWPQEDPRLTDFTEPVNLTFEAICFSLYASLCCMNHKLYVSVESV